MASAGETKGDDEMAREPEALHLKAPSSADLLRGMIASGKSVPSKVSAQ